MIHPPPSPGSQDSPPPPRYRNFTGSDFDLEIYQKMIGPIEELTTLQFECEQRMDDLPGRLREKVPNASVRLRAWRRTKHAQPYAVYWILFPRRRRKWKSQAELQAERSGKRRPFFVHQKVHSIRRLDTLLHHNMLDRYRTIYVHFFRRARLINEAHRVAARAMDSARKMLSSRRAGAHIEAHVSYALMPDNNLASERAQRVAEWAWHLAGMTAYAASMLQGIVEEIDEACPESPLKARFRIGPDHPYGRVVWKDERTGETYANLTASIRRLLKLSPAAYSASGKMEAQRRLETKMLKGYSSIVTDVLRKLKGAVTRTRRLLEEEADLARHGPPYIPPRFGSAS